MLEPRPRVPLLVPCKVRRTSSVQQAKLFPRAGSLYTLMNTCQVRVQFTILHYIILHYIILRTYGCRGQPRPRAERNETIEMPAENHVYVYESFSGRLSDKQIRKAGSRFGPKTFTEPRLLRRFEVGASDNQGLSRPSLRSSEL